MPPARPPSSARRAPLQSTPAAPSISAALREHRRSGAGRRHDGNGALTVQSPGPAARSTASAAACADDDVGVTTVLGANAYSGATAVNGVTLAVDGAIAYSPSPSTVAARSVAPAPSAPRASRTAARWRRQFDRHDFRQRRSDIRCQFVLQNDFADGRRPHQCHRHGTSTGGTVQAIASAGSSAEDLHYSDRDRWLRRKQFTGLTWSGSLGTGARNPHLTYDANDVFLVLVPGTVQLPAMRAGMGPMSPRHRRRGLRRRLAISRVQCAARRDRRTIADGLSQLSGEPGAGARNRALPGQLFMTNVFDNAFGGPVDDAGRNGGDAPLGYAWSGPPACSAGGLCHGYAARYGANVGTRWNVWPPPWRRYPIDSGPTVGSHTIASRVYGAVGGASYRRAGHADRLCARQSRIESFPRQRSRLPPRGHIPCCPLWPASVRPGLYRRPRRLRLAECLRRRTVTVSGTDTLHASFHPQAVARGSKRAGASHGRL